MNWRGMFWATITVFGITALIGLYGLWFNFCYQWSKGSDSGLALCLSPLVIALWAMLAAVFNSKESI